MTIPSATTLKLAIAILCALVLALLVHDRNRWKSTASLRQQQVIAEKAAHLATVAGYRAAAAQAREADAANTTRVRHEQARINERISDDFETRIAAARARSNQLRHEAASAAADPGNRRAAPVPSLPAAAGGAAETPGQNGLPPSDQLIATEQAIQLDELIKWVRSQAAVQPSASPQRQLGPQDERASRPVSAVTH
ncbi:MAG: hypothetical protein M3428_01640 [Pseudomonadota bacterium]|nr:hypothetical protein [Pseudomonadota bacterium]